MKIYIAMNSWIGFLLLVAGSNAEVSDGVVLSDSSPFGSGENELE